MTVVIRQLVSHVLQLAAIVATSLFSNFAVSQTTVNVAVVESNPIRAELSLTGNIVSTRLVAAGSEVSAQVREIYVEVGDVVEQGQLLVQLQDEPAQLDLAIKKAQLREDEASVTLATLEERRLYKLLKQKSISIERYDQANARLQQTQAAYAAHQAEIELLRDTIARHQLKAPFAGLIVEKPIEKGSWAGVGTVLMHIASLQQLRMELAVPQHYYARLSRNDSELSANILTSKHQNPITAPVERLIPFADRQRNFQIWLSVDNSQRTWLPGMSANALLQWRDDQSYNLSIPRDAIVRKANGEAIVWKVVRGEEPDSWSVQSTEIQVGNGSNGRIAIQSDELQADDRIVVRGNENLQPQQTIKPVLLHEAGQT